MNNQINIKEKSIQEIHIETLLRLFESMIKSLINVNRGREIVLSRLIESFLNYPDSNRRVEIKCLSFDTVLHLTSEGIIRRDLLLSTLQAKTDLNINFFLNETLFISLDKVQDDPFVVSSYFNFSPEQTTNIVTVGPSFNYGGYYETSYLHEFLMWLRLPKVGRLPYSTSKTLSEFNINKLISSGFLDTDPDKVNMKSTSFPLPTWGLDEEVLKKICSREEFWEHLKPGDDLIVAPNPYPNSRTPMVFILQEDNRWLFLSPAEADKYLEKTVT